MQATICRFGRILVFASLAMLPASDLAAQSHTPLTAPSEWSVYATDGTGNLLINSGAAIYSSTSTVNSFAALSDSALALSASRDWSVQTYATIGNYTLAPNGFIDLSLVVHPSSVDPATTRIAYTFELGNWGHGVSREVDTEVVLADNELSSGLDTERVFSTSIGLRVDYAASTKSLTFYFDHDGAGSAQDWQLNYPLPGEFSLTSGAADFGLTNTDTFSIVLVGSSEGVVVTSGTAYFTNLVVTQASAVPEPSTYACLLGALALGVAFWQRRARRAV